MELISIILFFVIMWGLGFSVTYFIKQKGCFESFFMNLAFGIAFFTVLATTFTILRVPLVWYLFLIIALVIPIKEWIKQKPKLRFKFKKSHVYLLVVLVLFFFTLSMYAKGAFSYDLYEDGDPWKHSGIVKYISLQNYALEPIDGTDIFQYVDSYPPGYDVLLSVMHQVSGKLIWSVKFFNVLLISLGIFFFYFFAKQFTGKRDLALSATFVLAMIPCYMSHFIWAHTLVILLIFPLFYSLEKIKENKFWIYPAIISYAAVLLAQPTQAFKISIVILIYFIINSLVFKKVQWDTIKTVICGGFLAFVVWWGPMLMKYGSFNNLLSASVGGANLAKGGITGGVGGLVLKFHGTADRVYTFADFFFASPRNMINNPIGVGVVLMLLLFFTILFVIWKHKYLFSKNNRWVLVSAFWVLFAFLGIHGEQLPVQLWAFRFWMLFAIFFSLFVSAGFFGLIKICKKVKFPVLLLILLIIFGVWFTSGSQKWKLNTMSWEHTAGEFAQYGNLDSWKYVANLPSNSKVFFPCRNEKNMDVAILGVDKYTCLWCADEKAFKLTFANQSGESVMAFAQEKGYDYLFIDGNCLVDFDQNATLLNNFLQNVSAELVHKSKGGFVWQI